MNNIEGKIHIPNGLKSDPRFILPDEVVLLIAKNLSLYSDSKIGIDPMCGVGTIPRVIHSMGGECHGIELDPHQHAIAKKELGPSAKIMLGDCKKIQTQKYDYIYTSPPFAWFNNTHPPKELAMAFMSMLKSGSRLIIDSSDVASRNGKTWNLAETQIKYFKKHGFEFKNSHEFKTKKQGVCDDVFLELEFNLI